jgi:hypothetical protein
MAEVVDLMDALEKSLKRAELASLYVRLRRTKGWVIPAGTVICDRRTVWGNPFRVGDLDEHTWEPRTAQEVVDLYRRSVEHDWPRSFARRVEVELRGRKLGCWCDAGSPCHVQDVLLPLANS